MEFSDEDRRIMRLIMIEAEKTGRKGNFPIAAALVINDELIDIYVNKLSEHNDLYSHAENTLIEAYSSMILEESMKGSKIELFSTLEPCFMCFGTILLHGIPKIVFSCKDPNGGIATVDKETYPEFYRSRWPEIRHGLFAEESYDMLISYFKSRDTPEFQGLLSSFQTLELGK